MIRQEFIDDIGPPSQRRYWNRLWKSMAIGLARQAQRRIARRLVVGQAFEADVEKFAGSFTAFQHQLWCEHQSLQRQNSQAEFGFSYDEYLENLKEGG